MSAGDVENALLDPHFKLDTSKPKGGLMEKAIKEKRPLVKRDTQEVMLRAVEKRFKKSHQAPREIQF